MDVFICQRHSLLDLTILLTKIYVGIYIINGLTNRNNPSKKLSSVIYGLSVSPLVINIPMNLQIEKTR
jgi:hypothetical protein